MVSGLKSLLGKSVECIFRKDARKGRSNPGRRAKHQAVGNIEMVERMASPNLFSVPMSTSKTLHL